MNIEELINSPDIEIAEMYCNIYLQTHALWVLDNVLKKYKYDYFPGTNLVALKEVMYTHSQSTGAWLKDPTRTVLLNLK